MNEMIEFQLTLSTADDESNLFSGELGEVRMTEGVPPGLEDGTYRVIDGQLVRVVSDVPIDL